MRNVSSLVSAVAIAASLAAGALSAAPALAAAGDIDLLKQYVGDWRGRGVLTGAEKETIVCRMSVKEGNQDKINYSGRCTMAGTTIAMNGTVAYVNNRFEAAMSSNDFVGTAVGRKRGNGIVFDLKEREKDAEGNDMDIAAQMTLSGGKINVNFEVVFPKTGDTIKASVPFSK